MEQQAKTIVSAMRAPGLKRLVFISLIGIYGDVPGEQYRGVLDPYRDSAAVIESSDPDYIILRPGWFTRDDEISYQLTQKGEPFNQRACNYEECDTCPARACLAPRLWSTLLCSNTASL